MVSVIVPLYNVAPFIVRCAESLFAQTLHDVEFIFVDDCSPDDSVSLLRSVVERHPSRKDRVRILRHGKNKGLPAARNTGLAAAGGEYVFHCDGDDFLEDTALEKLYGEAVRSDADIVWCGYCLSFSSNERRMSQPDYSSPEDAIRGMLSGKMKYNVWNKLVRRSLYTESGISFPEGHGMGEDMTMILLFARAGRVSAVDEPLYHYVRLNTGAMTQEYSDKKIEDVRYNVARTVSYLSENCGYDLSTELAFFKLNAKLPLLMSGAAENYRRWNGLYPEADRYIMRNREQSLRLRILQWLASKRMYMLVRLHDLILDRLVYGIRYR